MPTPFALKITRRRRAEKIRRRFVACLIFSATLAVVGFALGPLYSVIASTQGIPTSALVPISIVIAWLWVAVFAAGLCLCRTRGLWLLAEAPFVLFFPGVHVLSGACSLLGQCA